MPDLLLELFSEEIPARMQARAADDLRRLVTEALVERGILYEGAVAFATPRRLTLHVAGLPAKGKDISEERKGPRVGAPEAALAGFLKSTGLTLDQLAIRADGKKGESYIAVIAQPGRPTAAVLAEILPAIIRSFPWPKSMRWGAASAEPGSLRWVRPLQSILCTLASDGEEPEVVAFEIGGIASGDVTRGHRFMASDAIRVGRFDDYVDALERARVVLDPARRRDIILHDARDLAFAQGLELVEDPGLLEEVAGLVEWPVVLMGSFDAAFLDIPPEVIRTTIRANQKCFVLREILAPLAGRGRDGASRPGEGAPDGVAPSRDTPTPDPSPQGGGASALSNRFLLVSNLVASDGGAAIVAGNERVVRARLSDAKFFWDTDRRTPLADRVEKLKNIVFHEKLGTQYARVERIAALARDLAAATGADPDQAERAARLAKADLVTEMVGEFPELQGLMGRYYALAQGEPAGVAAAIEEHYKPLGPSDRVPSDPVSVAVALADKLDTLMGFWAIDEKPTGSKDPFALRRAALGVIRLVLENGLRVPLLQIVFKQNLALLPLGEREKIRQLAALVTPDIRRGSFEEKALNERLREEGRPAFLVAYDLLAFFHDRLKVYLRERGARHDLIDAVLGAGTLPPGERGSDGTHHRHAEERPQAASRSTQGGSASFEMPAARAPQDDEGGGRSLLAAERGNDDLLMVVRRVEALGAFLATADGANLLAGAKRAANILRIEEKKDGRAYAEAPDPALFVEPEERALADALTQAIAAAEEGVAGEDFVGALGALAALRPAVDAFFDKVTVNAEDAALRANRLRLLGGLRRATRAVADFARIEG